GRVRWNRARKFRCSSRPRRIATNWSNTSCASCTPTNCRRSSPCPSRADCLPIWRGWRPKPGPTIEKGNRNLNGIWRWCLLLLGLWAGMATAQEEPELLEPDRAFELSVRQVEPAALEVHYRIADGYYMYRDKFAFEAMPASVQLGQPVFPPGQVHDDEFFR